MSVLKRTKKKCDSLANNVKQMKSRQVFLGMREEQGGRKNTCLPRCEPQTNRTSLALHSHFTRTESQQG